ncbi:hypothetical protein B0O79_1992 [Flavobacteriaceae bacterium MAR_2009_75]|nr:hypothetical protein B0O79_1992 [Flavobacteriaceae bacterium MAR_2009_75]
MIDIKILQKLPINSGDYLILPNEERPTFIIPITSKWAYKKAISLIKPKDSLGNLKKSLLAQTPIALLKFFFTIVRIETSINNSGSGQLILPWNQDPNSKFTIFNYNRKHITLFKFGYGNAGDLINNEYKCIELVSKMNAKIIPEVKLFKRNPDYSVMETKFYKGNHPSSLPRAIREFFELCYKTADRKPFKEHPYIVRIKKVLLDVLDNRTDKALKDRILTFTKRFGKELIPVVIMHGDCSMTNIIETNDECWLIDWEEGIMDGVPLDVGYFDFRIKIDRGGTWEINSSVDFLVVMHYLYFQIKHGNESSLDKIEWKDKTVRVKTV